MGERRRMRCKAVAGRPRMRLVAERAHLRGNRTLGRGRLLMAEGQRTAVVEWEGRRRMEVALAMAELLHTVAEVFGAVEEEGVV